MPKIQIGILAGGQRSDGVETNATIGARHEYGDDGMPIRSFLRMPLNMHLSSYLEKSGAFDENALVEMVRAGNILVWLKQIAIVAETVVADAFDSGGFGKWKPSDFTYKKVHMTLVETQQLRNSITTRITE